MTEHNPRFRGDTAVSQQLIEKARLIKMLLTDCDGVLTDNGVYYSPAGELLKRFSIRDGMGVERLRTLVGVETGIISGENSAPLKRRAEKLGIEECHLGISDKAQVVRSIIAKRGLLRAELAYIGDDANDLEVFDLVGLYACPSDAFDAVKRHADIICRNQGGHGAFREFAEIIISAQAGR
ncbi:MAG: KdsC family phosphatase [Gammaproteobacteria bacterium]